jgi:hypothetical protein
MVSYGLGVLIEHLVPVIPSFAPKLYPLLETMERFVTFLVCERGHDVRSMGTHVTVIIFLVYETS